MRLLPRIAVRLVLLPFKLALALVGSSFRAGRRVGGLPVRAGFRATRLAGPRGVACFVLGVAVGLLFAPGPGRALRAKVRRRLQGGGPIDDAELAEQVAFELAHAPRTWHLAQPDVAVSAGRAQLRGTVPDEAARLELVRVASAMPGVAGVDDLLAVAAEPLDP
jgi:hypothetical protein